MFEVYRVEHKTHGTGPYLSPDETGEVWSIMGLLSIENTPEPSDEVYLTKNHVFGFETIKDLCSWFPLYVLKRLEMYDFEVVKYKVSDQHIGCLYKQVVFLKDKATKEEILNITQLQEMIPDAN